MHSTQEFISNEKIKLLQQQQYALFGHSAVKICHYTKSSIKKGKFCYKFKFYGIRSNQCIQMTPASNFCNQECVFCWRTLGWSKNNFSKFDFPKEIVVESIRRQFKQLIGFKGNPNANKKLFLESQSPKHAAISLSGEPTLYPLLPKLIDEFHSRFISTFVVSNGSNPKMIQKINPTQLYISLDAPNEETFLKLNRPMNKKNGWKNLRRSLKILKKKKGRTVLRITSVKNVNMHSPEEYAKLISMASPWFVEVKGYSWIGFSRQRLKKSNVPDHTEVGIFADELAKASGYVKINEDIDSCIHLLARKDLSQKSSWIDFKKFFKNLEKKSKKK